MSEEFYEPEPLYVDLCVDWWERSYEWVTVIDADFGEWPGDAS